MPSAEAESRPSRQPHVPRTTSTIAYQGAAPDMARIFRTLLPEAPVPAFLETDDRPDEKAPSTGP